MKYERIELNYEQKKSIQFANGYGYVLIPIQWNDFNAEAVAAEDGLVVHLKFDDDLIDSSGNGNHATCEYGKVTYEDGIHGKSAVFNGKTYIEIPDNDSLDLNH